MTKPKNTLNIGENNGNAKLTKADIIAIRSMYIPYYNAGLLAKVYGINRRTVRSIVNRETWGWL